MFISPCTHGIRNNLVIITRERSLEHPIVMRHAIRVESFVVMARFNQAEPNLENYGKKMRVFDGGRVFKWA